MRDERLNTRLGNYRLVRLIGKGGFARVYLGEHLALGTLAAIKLLRTKHVVNEEKVTQFYDEARLMVHLNHPRIVRVMDCSHEGTGEDTHFFVMDYAPHGLLRQYCEREKLLPLPFVVKYIKQIAEALQYVHDQGYIHRDVKPENILLDAQRNIWLCDFGIAITIPSLFHDHVSDVGGTVEYMAPEQLRRMPVPASDQYSLAIVTYELLVGNCPFHGTSTEVTEQHKRVHPPSLRAQMSGIPPAVERVVLKALSKNPRMRYPSVRAYAIALEQAATERPILHRYHPVNIHAQPLRTRSLPVEVQSQPVMPHQLSRDIQSEPLPLYRSPKPVYSEPLPIVGLNHAGSTMPLQSGKGQRPVPRMRQQVQAQHPQRRHSHPAKIMDALELIGPVIAGIFFSIGMGIAMFAIGVKHDVALSVSAVILLIMLDIFLLNGWAAILAPLVLLAFSMMAGILFNSLTFFWMSTVFMCIVIVVSRLSQRHN